MFVYAGVGEYYIPHQQQALGRTVATGIALMSIFQIGIALMIRARMLRPALAALRTTPDDAVAIKRWKSGTIIGDTLAEAVFIEGFALRVLGGALVDAAPFYVAGALLMLLWWPRRPELQETAR